MQVRVERNIYFQEGTYKVALTRRNFPSPIYGGRFQSLGMARIVRDKLEAEHPARKPHGYSVCKRKPMRQYMAERRARWRAEGLCIICGCEKPDAGFANCRSCLDIKKIKRQAATV